jgi:C4-dicarboxylate transporter DctM subunit
MISLLAIGAPVGLALMGAAILVMLYDPLVNPTAVMRAFFNFTNGYTLLAIPFFIYAGFLMEKTGLVGKLFDFADAVVGWLPGGFAYATLMAAVLFGAISGSSTAMAAAMGIIAYPEMIKRGYPKWMAAGVIACGGGIALLIPPSLTLILFGVLTETDIIKLFFAGVVPGLLLAVSDAIIILGVAWYLKMPSGTFELKRVFTSAWGAMPALMMPVLILGGLYGGLFTPTEAGAASCAYAFIYGLIAKRAQFIKELLPVTQRAVNLTAIVFFLVGCVGVFQFLLANKGWPQDMAAWVGGFGLLPLEFLAVLMVVLLFLSMFLNGVAMLVLTVPVIYPISLTLGIDPIHLAILFALAVEMGGVIPPVGLNLFAVAGTTGVPLTQVMKGSIPFLITDGLVMILVLFFPIIALWLPDLAVQSHFN